MAQATTDLDTLFNRLLAWLYSPQPEHTAYGLPLLTPGEHTALLRWFVDTESRLVRTENLAAALDFDRYLSDLATRARRGETWARRALQPLRAYWAQLRRHPEAKLVAAWPPLLGKERIALQQANRTHE